MALENLNLITVTGTWVLANGQPGQGTVSFVPANDVILIDPATNEIVLPVPFTVELDENGSISVDLPATNDPDLAPVGWVYRVTESIGSPALKNRSVYTMSLPIEGGAVDLSDVVPPGPDGATEFTYATLAELESRVPDDGTEGYVLKKGASGVNAWEAESGGGGATDHGALTGLSDDDHTQYALADGSRGNFAATDHNHDGVYDDAGTAVAAVGTHNANSTGVHGIADTADLIVEGDPRLSDAREPTTHNHDDRYYTETEADALLAGKSDTTHTHDHGGLTGLADDDHPQYPLFVNTDDDPGRTIYVGSVDPSTLFTPAQGDLWARPPA